MRLIPVAIKGFRNKGLEQFFATGNKRGIQAKHVDRLRLILGRLNAATDPRDMDLRASAFTSCTAIEEGRGRSR